MQALQPAARWLHLRPPGEVELSSPTPEVAVAGVNGPAHIVVSGDGPSVGAITAVLIERGVRVQALTVSHAFHSPLMLPMLDEFRRVAESVSYRSPQRRLVSNVTGALIGSEIARE